MEQLLIAFINTLEASLKKLHAELGDYAGLAKLTINQLQYIEAIHQLGEPTITDIAAALQITKASVTTGVNKLAALGFLLKIPSTVDKRVCHVHLTPTAEQLVQAKYLALQEYMSVINAALSAEEAAQFEAILHKLVAHFAQSA